MALVLLHDFCLEKNDTTGDYEIVVTDTTGVYNASTNPTGWQHASTVLAANVTAATITISTEDSAGTVTEYDAINVLSQIPNPVTGQFEFTAIDDVSIIDGIYTITYAITAGGTTYTSCKEKVLYPTVACCISETMNALKDDINNSKLYADALKVKAWENGLKQAAATIDKSSIKKILSLLEEYCDSTPGSDCGCN